MTATDDNALGAPVAFTKISGGVNVEGVNGYTAEEYDVWYYQADAAAGIANAMALKITWA